MIGIHEDTQRLLFLASTSDFEEVMSLPGHLLRKNESLCIHSRLVDSHIYVIKKWIIDFLSQVLMFANSRETTNYNYYFLFFFFFKSDGFSTIKGELLPFIIKKQMSRPGANSSESEKPFSVVNVNVKVGDVFNVSYKNVINS